MLKIDTKKILLDACIDLLQEKPFSDITVIDICEKAEASRSVFYKYFHDKFELIAYEYEECMDAVVEELENNENFTMYDATYARCKFYFDRKNIYEKLVTDSEIRFFDDLFIQIYAKHATSFAKYNLKKENLPKEVEYAIYYHAVAQTNMVKEWIRKGYELSLPKFTKILTDNSSHYHEMLNIPKKKIHATK